MTSMDRRCRYAYAWITMLDFVIESNETKLLANETEMKYTPAFY